MYTAAGIASQIVTAIVTEFSQKHRINPAHLLEDTNALTPVEVMRAQIALSPVKAPVPDSGDEALTASLLKLEADYLDDLGRHHEARSVRARVPKAETVYDEQAQLDPEPWVGFSTGRRYARELFFGVSNFEPRPGYEQRRARYGVAS